MATAKDLQSPIKPITDGTTPPPTKNAKGAVKETATFLRRGGVIKERAVNPAGKKHTAIIGCRKTKMVIIELETVPNRNVIPPVINKTTINVRFGPKRSDAHPPANAIPIPGILEKDMRVLAQF